MTQIKSSLAGSEFLYRQSTPDDIFTPEEFTDEHRMIAKTAHQFVVKDVDPYREAIENQNFNRVVTLLKKAGQLGLLGHSIPEEYGGIGLDKISKCVVGEVVGKTSGYGVAQSNHTCIATLPITHFGTHEQKSKYLPKLASGEYLGAYCLTEPSAGSDALASQTTAVLNEEGTHYLLNGTKLYITNAVFSDTFIVYAKINGNQFSAFIVERNFPGLTLGPEEKKMGIKGSSTRSVILEDCQVPIENLLGDAGKGHVIALNVLNLGRFNLGSACTGGAKHGLKLALQHTNERKQFGRTIAEFTATQEKVARMMSRVYASESLQYRTAFLLEGAMDGLYNETDHKIVGNQMMEYAVECAICKVFGSETLDQVVDESLQLHGGAGFIQEYPIEQMYRDSRINRIFEGTNEVNRLLIVGTLFKKVSKGDISLEEFVEKARRKLTETVSVTTNEEDAIQSIRNVFLFCVGTAFQQHGERLMDNQESLMKLSNIAIALYAAESAVLRALKHQGELKMKLARTFLEETLQDVESSARMLLMSILPREQKQQAIQLIFNNLSSFDFGSSLERNREIAQSSYKKLKYDV
ncbi:acyl-CoA dehydrogenase family protein [Guptibacillus hwajinpoensis]|uniref:Alkylation response protein AidB-like acyl-CoA dehydrogenase n=1 Tax=Guptibacillus hwajinpoensis TaxID=208199 RepID=A0ABU0K4S1_9BACL|nr:acyl-CoA dehydrogenase family protein [Alkalihalobacillus hemicentroti]MDQ0483294.1 alkylation response protein AidB-like acyl-CoA dehydrogenase [Alkalihalobacillus hemicentroti]